MLTKLLILLLLTLVVVNSALASSISSTIEVNLLSYLNQLSSAEFTGRQPQTVGHNKAKNYIQRQLSANLNNDESFARQTFFYSKGFKEHTGTNLIYTKQGSKFAEKFIVITAHYDHLGQKLGQIYHGADDNASGVATLMALKEWLQLHTVNYSILLVATDAEEHGLKGASAFIKSNFINKADIKINLNLDMIAYGVKNKYLIINGIKTHPKFDNIINNLNPASPLKFNNKNRLKTNGRQISNNRIKLSKASDHYEFHKVGIPYLFVTGENHRFYHTPMDTADKIDNEFFQQVFNSIILLVVTLDNEL